MRVADMTSDDLREITRKQPRSMGMTPEAEELRARNIAEFDAKYGPADGEPILQADEGPDNYEGGELSRFARDEEDIRDQEAMGVSYEGV